MRTANGSMKAGSLSEHEWIWVYDLVTPFGTEYIL
jgi:hypothetical protein